MDLMAYVPHFSEAPNLELKPVIEHNCEQPEEVDELENQIQGNTLWSKLRRWFLRQRILSRKHPLTRWCVKSTTAVQYEISRHLRGSFGHACLPHVLLRAARGLAQDQRQAEHGVPVRHSDVVLDGLLRLRDESDSP